MIRNFFYPDSALVTVTTGSGDGWGGSTTEIINVIGRYDMPTKDILQRAQAGESFNPSFMFYMPLEQPNIPVGSSIRVTDVSSGLEYSGTVQQFNKGLLNAYVVV